MRWRLFTIIRCHFTVAYLLLGRFSFGGLEWFPASVFLEFSRDPRKKKLGGKAFNVRVCREAVADRLQAAGADLDIDVATIVPMREAVKRLRDELKTLKPEPAPQRERAIVEAELQDAQAKLQAVVMESDVDGETITQMREVVKRLRDELKTLKPEPAPQRECAIVDR